MIIIFPTKAQRFIRICSLVSKQPKIQEKAHNAISKFGVPLFALFNL